jgi:histidine triad (HIT) family protein
MDCVFCKKFEGLEDEVYIFEPLNPVTPGHKLVVPHKHVTDFSEQSWLTAMVMSHAAKYVAERGGDWNLITSKGRAATQSVFHLHVHLVPRTEADGLLLPWSFQVNTEPKSELTPEVHQ